jgi:hypothetical protein
MKPGEEMEGIMKDIDALIEKLDIRFYRFNDLANRAKKREDFRALHKLMLYHTCCINMLKSIKELLEA